MSSQVTTAFVEQYKSNVMSLVQQKGSRLRGAVMVDSAVNGKKKFTEQVGTTNAQLRTSRHSDSPLVNTPHLRRSLTLDDYEWGDLIDDADKVRLLIDPTSAYAQNAAWAMGRAMDDVILTALHATAYTGVSGGDETPLGSGQKVSVDTQDGADSGDAGLNTAKLRSARKILLANEVEMDEELYCSVNAQMLDNLLQTTEVGSYDYNSVKALVRGEIDTWLGFKFIHTERLNTIISGGTDQACMCWAKSGLELGIGSDIKSSIAPRADKSFSTYVYYSMCLGATRLEEEKVVEIACDPTAGVTAS
jgi:hypothetical protein